MSEITLVKFKQKLADKWSNSYITTLFGAPKSIEIDPVNFHDVEVPEFPVVISHTSEGFAFLEHLHKIKKRYGLVLMSDETLTEPYDYLSHNECVFCVRQYIHPELLQDTRVSTIPLGVTDGLYYHCSYGLPKFDDRKFTWSFAGSIKADRAEAIDSFTQLKPYQLNVFDKFHDPNHLDAQQYAELLKQSKFIICPQGGCNIDSFRIYEALTCGAIPVVMKNHGIFKIVPTYWHALFRGVTDLPFIVADDWAEAAHLVGEVLRKDEGAEMQRACIEFWQEQSFVFSQIVNYRCNQLLENF